MSSCHVAVLPLMVLRDLRGETVTLEPLRKFPTVCDLVVDRGIIQENLKKVSAYIGEYREADPKEYEHMYAAGKCLKCGLCLEVCPNYDGGSTFFGAAFANDCYLIASRSGSMEASVREAYGAHFAKGCSKALSCVDVCPMKIPTFCIIDTDGSHCGSSLFFRIISPKRLLL